jgi:hypothetical protein
MATKVILKHQDVFDEAVLKVFRQDPVFFTETIVFNKNKEYFLSDQQKLGFESVLAHKRTSIAGGRGVGKDGLMAFIILWWICVYPHSKIIFYGLS